MNIVRLILTNHFAALLLLAGLAPHSLRAEVREFTSSDGRKLQAELTGYANGQVQLNVGGKSVTVPLSGLSEADREYIDLWATDPSREISGADAADLGMEDYLLSRGYDAVKYNDEKFAMIVEIQIADRPHPFIINTALPYSYLDGPMADVHKLTVNQIQDWLIGPGGRVPIGETKLEGFRVGSSLFDRRVFRVANLAQTGLNNTGVKVDGVLGFDFLMEYGAVLDYNTKTIYFLPPPPPEKN